MFLYGRAFSSIIAVLCCCQTSFSAPGNRVRRSHGGEIVGEGEMPFMAFIVCKNDTGVCSGSLIDERHVLTAAHCFNITDERQTAEVYLGGLEEFAGVQVSATVYQHPEYDTDLERNDIAVLKVGFLVTVKHTCQLHEPAKLSGNVKFTLATPAFMEELKPKSAIAVGYGDSKVNETLNVLVSSEGYELLRKVNLSIFDEKLCQAAEADPETDFYGSPEFEPGRDICAGAKDRETGSGDSGGPLLVFDKESQTFVQIGITSYGAGIDIDKKNYPRAYGGDVYPGSYQRVDIFLDWIESIKNLDA